MMKKYTVLVLMSTYNGAHFLREQLDSILAQQGVDVYILIRDDGSVDNTCKILEEYSSRNSNLTYLLGDNMGFVKSFSALVKMALEYKIQSDFYAFADQDDIWFSDKLCTACKALASQDDTKPNLFTSNSMQIDADGNELGLFHQGLYPMFRRGNILIYGTEQGCSMAFNYKAIELYSLKEPVISFHDRWMYLICFYLGTVQYNHRPLFYYRIHGNNTLAAIHGNTRHKSILNRLMGIVNFYFSGNPITNHQIMASEFYKTWENLIQVNDRGIIENYLKYRRNFISKFHVMFGYDYQCPYRGSIEEYPHRRFIFFNLL